MFCLFNTLEKESPQNLSTLKKLQNLLGFPEVDLKILDKSLTSLSSIQIDGNNAFVKAFKKTIKKDTGISLKTTESYEILSVLVGEVTWNVAKSKGIDFHYHLFKNFPPFPTGFTGLDLDLFGGIRRNQITSILGSSGSGTTTCAIMMACNALKSGRNLKVLHINLQGTLDLLIQKYISLLFNCPMDDVSDYSLHEYPNLRIHNAQGFEYSLNQLNADVERIHETFKFDILIIHGQLVSAPDDSARVGLARVFRSLTNFSHMYDCAVVSPVQATKRSQDQGILRASDISESFEIARVSSVILTLSGSNQSPYKTLLLEKNRMGRTNQSYDILLPYLR